ncbi:MAG: hypothetical protein M3548_07325 [Actinomycetota bacterium]|nr:hypothetical protein [Actinomycetota bacterium]
MTSYGFRLFKLTLRLRNGRLEIPFITSNEKESWQYSNHLQQILSANKEKRERGVPHVSEPEDESTNEDNSKPIFTVDEFGIMSETITFTMSYGVQTGHDLAMADPDNMDDEDLDISKHFPSRKYRGALIMPKGNGDKEAVLALECISRACPRSPLLKWISQWSKAAAIPAENGKIPPWWKLVGNPLVDEDTLTKFMEKAAAETIFLKRHKVTTDRKREVDELDLRVEITRESLRTQALGIVKQWVLGVRSGKKVEGHDAARSVALLVADELEGIDFDETKIEISDPISGKKKKISPSRLPDVFTYKICTANAPEVSVLHASIRAVVNRVQPNLSGTLDWSGWPPPKE